MVLNQTWYEQLCMLLQSHNAAQTTCLWQPLHQHLTYQLVHVHHYLHTDNKHFTYTSTQNMLNILNS